MAPRNYPVVAVGDLESLAVATATRLSRVTRLELDLGLDVRLHAMQSAGCLGES